LGEKVYTNAIIEINFDVKKPRSSSVSAVEDVFSGKSLQKAKKIKERYPHVKFEEIFNYVSK